MRLDASYLHFVSQEQLRVMTSIQLGMRNHEWVPTQVIGRISRLRGGQTYKVLVKLLKNKFVVHTGKRYDGYKLTYLGYDYLALQTFIKRGILKDVITKIGVGKQSDVYKCVTPQGEMVVLKLTRLGRNSFRSIKKNRQYIGNRTNYNWLYLSRLSSVREFLFMQLLHENNFTTPRPIDTNRHAIVMSLVEGSPLCHIQRIGSQEEIKSLFEKALNMLVKLAQNGLIHGDYNEFNLITNEEVTKLTVIDFPQCISVNHPNADAYFNRDVECIYKFFDKMVQREISDYDGTEHQEKQQGDMSSKKTSKRFVLNVADYPMPVLSEIKVQKRLDRQLKTKGHITLTEQKQLEQVLIEERNHQQQQKNMQQSQSQQSDQAENQVSSQEQEEDQNEQEQQENNQKLKEEGGQFSGRQLKKMSFDHDQTQLEEIHPLKHQHETQQIYDKELQALMSELNHSNLQPEFTSDPLAKNPLQQSSSSDQQQQQEERPEFKGLTAYQIRQKIKQEKRLEREKRKQQMTEDEYIKNALKRNKKKPQQSLANKMIGNRGNKKKNRANAEDLKYGYQMM